LEAIVSDFFDRENETAAPLSSAFDDELLRLGDELATAQRGGASENSDQSDARLRKICADIDEDGFSQSIGRRLRRALYSILALLETLSGMRIETCRAYYMSPTIDPFRREAEAA
jgi:hypothetical protein